MKLPVLLSVMTVASCFGEPVSTVLDEKGHATCTYKIDAVFPEGVFVRTGGKTVWLDVPFSQARVRNALTQNQNKVPEAVPVPDQDNAHPQPRVVAATPVPAGGGWPASAKVNGVTFDLRAARRTDVAMGQSIRIAQQEKVLDEAVRRIPGADSDKELPWEFVRNEAAMWMIWFSTADESVPENARVNEYILKQHFPPMLLYRLLIKPWMPRHKKSPGS